MSNTPPSLLTKPLQPPVPKFNLIATLEKELQNIPEHSIMALSRKIYPVENLASNAHNSLFRTLVNYFMIQGNKGQEYATICGDVIGFAGHISNELMGKMGEILKKEDVKNRLMESCKKNSYSLPSSQYLNNGGSKKTTSSSLLDNLCNRYSKESSNKYSHLLDGGFRRENNIQENQDFGAIVADKYMKDKNSVENLINRISLEKELFKAGKIENKKCLICDNLFVSIDFSKSLLDKNIFKCLDCGEIFHKKCMERENNCSFCQLSNINPLQKTRTTLFLGVLKKGTKIHEFSFELSKSHLKPELSEFSQKQNQHYSSFPTIELRSIRMKDKKDPVSNFINLFPDACSLMVNGKLMKEFEPLHKQSSLKYRRDECMKISTNVQLGNNKIVITERINKKDMKSDERIEIENHLVGVFIVENLQIPRSSDNSYEIFSRFLNVIGSTTSTFEESSVLLKESLFMKEKSSIAHIEEDQELVCDSVKVPLTCSLTLQKMKFPGRTIFCKHFSCFDIENFFLLNAQAKLPKWQCPICKASAYKFKIDCVLNSILSELNKLAKENKELKNMKIKDNERVAEVELNRLFEIKLLNSEGCLLLSKGSNKIKDPQNSYVETQFVPFWINRIDDLPIEGKNKRSAYSSRQSIDNRAEGNQEGMSEALERPASKLNSQTFEKNIKNKTEELNIAMNKNARNIEIIKQNLKSKEDLKNSEMKDEKEEKENEKAKEMPEKNAQPNSKEKVLEGEEYFDAEEPIRKLQLYDSSDNCMKNGEKVGDKEENDKKKDESNYEDNQSVPEIVFKLPTTIFPKVQKSDTVQENLETSKMVVDQQNSFDQVKKVFELGASLIEGGKIQNIEAAQNNDKSFTLSSQLQSSKTYQHPFSHSLSNVQHQKEYGTEISELKGSASTAYLYADNHKPEYFDQSKIIYSYNLLNDNNVLKDEKHIFGRSREEKNEEERANFTNQVSKTITIQPQILSKKELSSKQKERLERFLQNGFISEKSNSSKHDPMLIRKRDNNSIKEISKGNVKDRNEKRNLPIPENADIIELSD